MFEELIVGLESLADNVLQVYKVLEKAKKQAKTKGKKPSSKKENIKKLGVDNMMQNIIQYTTNDGMLAIYQPKGYLSFREKEKRWMGRFRQLDRKEKCVYAKTKKECKEKLDLAIKNYCISINNKDKECKDKTLTRYATLNEWFNYWLETFKKQEIKESTYTQYVETYNRYTNNTLGERKITDITSIIIQEHLNNIEAISGQKRIYQYLKELFNLLHQQNYIRVNPMNLVVLPKKDIDKVQDDEDESNEILLYKNEKILLEYLARGNKNKYWYPIKFGLYSGLRRGEILGLQWKHIDFENEIIKVRQQFNITSKKISSVKSKAAIRDVVILPQAREVLQELYTGQDIEEFIFGDCLGFTQRTSLLSRTLGFRVNPHMLRHTFASRTYYAGVDPKRIQQLLGHENIDVTLNTYTHVLEAEDKEIILEMKNFYLEKGIILTLS
jgi:integrase